MKEIQYQRRVTETCNYLGLRYYHTYDSRMNVAGYPDLTIVGPGGVLFVELKADKGRVTPQQEAWIRELRAAGSRAFVSYPKDWEMLLRELNRIARRTV